MSDKSQMLATLPSLPIMMVKRDSVVVIGRVKNSRGEEVFLVFNSKGVLFYAEEDELSLT